MEAQMTQRKIPIVNTAWDRPRTGALQFVDDWPGVFIRGKDSRQWGGALRTALRLIRKVARTFDDPNGELHRTYDELRELNKRLNSCHVTREAAKEVLFREHNFHVEK
jgi:hypothetical protein